MQAVTQALCREFQRTRSELSVDKVEQAFDDLANDPSVKDKLRHFRSRLEKYYEGTKLKVAQHLLRKLSMSGSDGLSKKDLFNEVIDILGNESSPADKADPMGTLGDILRDLENEFYIFECQAGCFDFASGVLKHWWRKYYG